MNTQPSVPAFITHADLKWKKIFIYCLVSFESWELILQFQVSSGLTKLDETISYCWCPIAIRWSLWLQQWSLWLHHCDVIHWDKQSCVTMALDLYNLCVSVTWPLACAFHIPCTHTPEIIDMHRGVCDNVMKCYRPYCVIWPFFLRSKYMEQIVFMQIRLNDITFISNIFPVTSQLQT